MKGVEIVERSFEEEKARLTVGTVKWVLFTIMEGVGPEGITVGNLHKLSEERNMYNWEKNQDPKKTIMGALVRAPSTFARVGRGRYAIRSMPGVVPWEDPDDEKSPSGRGGKTRAAEFSTSMERLKKQRLNELGEELSFPLLPDEDEAQLDALARTEKLAAHGQQLIGAAKAKLDLAEERVAVARHQYQEVEASSRAAVAAARAQRESDTPPAMFDLPPQLAEYTGDPEDHRAVAMFRQEQQAALEQLQLHREAWLSEQRRDRDADAAGQLLAGPARLVQVEAQKQLLQAMEAAELARRQHTAAVKMAAEGELALRREQVRQQVRMSRERDRLEKEAAKAREREEKERRRVEALTARRYPIDDLTLLREMEDRARAEGAPLPRKDVFQAPCYLDAEESARVPALMYVADMIGQFGKTLDLQPLSYDGLEAAVGCNGGGCSSECVEALRGNYERLLQVVVRDYVDADNGRLEKRWLAALQVPGTWPEVMRRYILSRAGTAGPNGSRQMVGDDTLEAVMELTWRDVDTLSPGQHLALLRFLCDEVLDTEMMRGVIQKRLEGESSIKTSMRADIAEDRRKLQQLLDAEKEQRKRKRGDMRGSGDQDGEDAEPQAPEPAAAPQPEADTWALGKRTRSSRDLGAGNHGAAAHDVDSEDDEQEPSWELPDELAEYTGNPTDRKALNAFRQAQTSARLDIDKRKARWVADKRRRAKERNSRKQAAADAQPPAPQKRLGKDKREAEALLAQTQDAYQKELDKYVSRRQPLGLDRHHRRYWWGLAGLRAQLLVEDPMRNNRWGVFSRPEDVSALSDSLQPRGCREKELKQSLDKVQSAIASAMRRGAANAAGELGLMDGSGGEGDGREEDYSDDGGDRSGALVPAGPSAFVGNDRSKLLQQEKVRQEASLRQLPMRGAKASAIASITEQSGADHSSPTVDPRPVDQVTLQAAVETLQTVSRAAEAAKVTGPADGWEAWRKMLARLLTEDEADDNAGAAAVAAVDGNGAEAVVREEEAGVGCASIIAKLQPCALQLEQWMHAATSAASSTPAPDATPAELAAAPATAKAAAAPAEDDGTNGEGNNAEGNNIKTEPSGSLEQQSSLPLPAPSRQQQLQQAQEDRKQRSKRRLTRNNAARLRPLVPGDVPEEVESDEEGAPPIRPSRDRRARFLWRNPHERLSWRRCVEAACTAARIGYCCAVLGHAAATPMRLLAAPPRKR